jgi:hypothetical protein
VVGVEGEERMGLEDMSSLLAMLFDGREECDRKCLLGVVEEGEKGGGGRR